MSGGHRDDDIHHEKENAYKAVHSVKKSWKDSRARFDTFLASFSQGGYGFKKTGSAFNSARHPVIQKALYSSPSSLFLSLFLSFPLIFFLLKQFKARLTQHRWFVKIFPLKLQSYPHLSFSNSLANIERTQRFSIDCTRGILFLPFFHFFLIPRDKLCTLMWITREEHSEISDFLIKIQEDKIIILNIMDIMMIMQLLIEIHSNALY